MNTKAALFDLDGTLVDSLPLIVRTYRRVFKEMGIPWGNSDVVKMIGLPLRIIGRHFAGNRELDFEKLYQHYYHKEHDLYTRLFTGTLEMLEELKQNGLKLGIVTSKGRTGALRAVHFTGLDSYMDIIVTAHDVTRHKPEPEALLYALNTLGINSADSIYIGDSSYDIMTGKNAGTRTLGVTWGLGSRGELEKLNPDGLIEQWPELGLYL